MLITSASVSDLSGAIAAAQAGVGGIVLMGNNPPGNLAAEISSVISAASPGVAPMMMTDEEGGAVQRLASLIGSIPSPREMAATMSTSAVRALAAGVGTKMRALGIGMDLAPVVDLDAGAGPSATDPDGTRSFSSDASVATAYAQAFAKGLSEAGVIPVLKHFPGLGGASANTDVASAHTLSFTELKTSGLLPFEAMIKSGAAAVMVSNATVPGLSDVVPTSLSTAVVTGLLREQLGFNGVIMTDSLQSVAISNYQPDLGVAALDAFAAGNDMAMFAGLSPNEGALFKEVLGTVSSAIASGELSRPAIEASVGRILLIKGAAPNCIYY